MQNDNIQVLDKIALVNLDVHTWSGRKKLRPEDIKGHVPPKKLASLGSKRIVDPKSVATFETLKRRAERLLGSVGIRLMGTYAVPLDRAEELVAELSSIREEFNTKKSLFLQSYDQSVEAWITEQEEWGSIIRSAITPVAEVRNQLSFGWQVFHVQPTSIDDSGLDDQIGGMAGQLFSEISREASRCFEDSFLMKLKVGQRALRPLRSIQEKLKGLSFLDGRAFAVSEFLDETLNSIPKVGSIEGEPLNKLFGLLVVLSSTSKIAEYGQALLDGHTIGDKDLIALSGLDEYEDDDISGLGSIHQAVEKGMVAEAEVEGSDSYEIPSPAASVAKPISTVSAHEGWF
ncbi:MAG: DUF3150 domain-containing protein [Halomonadaceae bacterium]|nr:DUF3150 domain-containing protein [Halomonadaceae bacterium]